MVNHGNKMMLGDGDTIPISECALKVNNVGGTKDVMFYFIYYFSHLVSVTSNERPHHHYHHHHHHPYLPFISSMLKGNTAVV